MRTLLSEAHQHFVRENPFVYAGCAVAVAAAAALWLSGHDRVALCVFIGAGFAALRMARYK
jgi:hypothetical protein